MFNIMFMITLILVFFVGASIGSFSLVTVMRGNRGQNWVKGRSACEHCGKELHWWELIPTVSFLMLGGKCSKCKTKIDPTHFVAETGLGIIYTIMLISYLQSFFTGIQAISYTIAATVVWKNVMSDLMYYQTSTIDIYVAAIIVSILNGCWIPTLIMIVLATLIFSRDNFKMFGAGDIDVLILIFAAYGHWYVIINTLLLASMTALIAYVIHIRKTEEKRIPFVPFLFTGFMLSIFGIMFL